MREDITAYSIEYAAWRPQNAGKSLNGWGFTQTPLGELTALPVWGLTSLRRPSCWWEAAGCSLPKNSTSLLALRASHSKT